MVSKVHAAHILVKDEATAKNIFESVKNGGDFSSLAKSNSICPSKKSGGDLGWFCKGEMVKPFESAAFAAKPGDVVGPVKTEFGWHVIKIIEQR